MSARAASTASLFDEPLAPSIVAYLYQIADRHERDGIRDLVALHEACAQQTGFRPVATYRVTSGQALACYACSRPITAEPTPPTEPRFSFEFMGGISLNNHPKKG